MRPQQPRYHPSYHPPPTLHYVVGTSGTGTGTFIRHSHFQDQVRYFIALQLYATFDVTIRYSAVAVLYSRRVVHITHVLSQAKR